MASEYTENYNLDLYTDADKPNLRDQYNAAMRKIDTQLDHQHDDLAIVTEFARSAKDEVDELTTNTIPTMQGQIDTLQNTTIPPIQTSLNEVVNVTIPGIQQTVADLDSTLDGATDDIAELRQDVDAALATAAPHAVVIGDSWSSTGYGPSLGELWFNQIAPQLNVEMHNFARGGQGYLSTGTPFSTQLNNAIADTTFDNDEVSYVFIQGSLNDKGNWDTQGDSVYREAVSNVIMNAKANFPHAKIIVIGTQNGLTADARTTSMSRSIADVCAACSVVFIPMRWLFVNLTDLMGANGHPTTAGQAYIGAYVISNLFGAYFKHRNRYFDVTENNGVTVNTASVRIVDNQLHIRMVGHSTAATGNGTLKFAGNVLACPEFQLSPIVGVNTANEVRFISTDPAGTITFHDNGHENTNFYYCTCFSIDG